jgi:hypothetical protein
MKVGDLVKFKDPRRIRATLALSPQDNIGLITKRDRQQLWGLKNSFREIANVTMTATQNDIWIDTQELEVIDESR